MVPVGICVSLRDAVSVGGEEAVDVAVLELDTVGVAVLVTDGRGKESERTRQFPPSACGA